MSAALSFLSSLVVPLIIAAAAVYASARKTDVFGALTDGAKSGLEVIVRILPTLAGLLCGVYMLRASGALDAITSLLSPVFGFLGIPEKCAPLMLLRPLSGSGALAAGTEIIRENGADSFAGRLAAVMLASSETTFYTAAIYFGAAGTSKTRYAIPSALMAELAAFIASVATVRLFFGA